MMILVIGGSGSGKSDYAEELACSLAGEEHSTKYYLATMRIFDEEGKRKIERHRARRSGKGFLTMEQPVRIGDALSQMETGKKVVLVECVSNLTANEMFAGPRIRTKEEVAESILKDMERLREKAAHMVVVSNQLCEDGMVYEKATMDYIDAVGKINRALAARADRVVEMVVGIPVLVKQEGGRG